MLDIGRTGCIMPTRGNLWPIPGDQRRKPHEQRMELGAGIRRVHASYPKLPIFTAAVDRALNDKGYILPGLGDAGDRLFGV